MIRKLVGKIIKGLIKIKYIGKPIEYSRFLGVHIGEGCKIHANPETCFSTEPFLITLGNHVLVANGVKMLTHDGSGFTLAFGEKDAYYDIWGPINIGNNVYIGTNALILPNVSICDNVIIAAGAVVSENIVKDGVYVGVPAKRKKTFDEYKSTVRNKAVNNYGLSFKQRVEKYKRIHPDWFQERV